MIIIIPIVINNYCQQQQQQITLFLTNQWAAMAGQSTSGNEVQKVAMTINEYCIWSTMISGAWLMIYIGVVLIFDDRLCCIRRK